MYLRGFMYSKNWVRLCDEIKDYVRLYIEINTRTGLADKILYDVY